MIYRFKTRDRWGRQIELQAQAPAKSPINKVRSIAQKMFREKDIQVEPLKYIGSIDTDFKGVVLPVCETEGCNNPVDAEGKSCSECRRGTFGEWYDPTASGPANNVCMVRGCGKPATYHVCNEHAAPGISTTVGKDWKSVISSWLVERDGRKSLMYIDQYVMGFMFGGRHSFEEALTEQGYTIHHVISDPEQTESAKRDGISSETWSSVWNWKQGRSRVRKVPRD